jgi:hypothetical protein
MLRKYQKQGQQLVFSTGVGIGFKRDNKENIVNLFDWDNGEVKELEKLTTVPESRNTLVDKNIVVLFISASCFMRCQLI